MDEFYNQVITDSWTPKVWCVKDRRIESHDTVTIDVEPENLANHICPRPGQFNMIYSFGIGEIPISFSRIGRNTYSHTIRSVGLVSNALTKLTPGAKLGIRGPFGSFWDLKGCDGHDIVVVAGGVGIAPLKPLIEQIIDERRRFHSVSLLYGARDPSQHLFDEDFREWQKNINVLRTVDTAGAKTDVSRQWKGHIGVVTDLLSHISFQPQNTIAYLCGPEIMMRYTIARLVELGVNNSNMFLSMERNMKCALGFCGHCQFGESFVCKDGPVYRYKQISHLLTIKEV